MKRILKRVTAIILTVAITVTAAACSDTSVAMTVNGNSIMAGEYIYSQFSALNNAMTKFGEDYPDVDTSAEGFDYYKYQLDGIDFRDWVVNETVKICTRRAAYSKLFDDLGLEFTSEEAYTHRKAATETWTVEDGYLPYYGIEQKTWGEYYETLGISKASFQKVYENEAKAEKVFMAYYGEGGEFEVSDQTVWNELETNFARYRMLEIELTDVDGNTVEDTEELKVFEQLGEDYVTRLEKGELFSEIVKAYDDFIEQRYMEAYPEYYEDEDDEDEDETDEEEVITENDLDGIIAKDSTTLSEELIARIFEMELGKPELFKTEDMYYVLVRLDISEREDWFTEYHDSLLYKLKGEEMLEKANTVADALTVEKNQAALNRYEPKKLM